MKDGVATGVVLASGEEISAKAVMSNADPKRTLMKLVDSTHLAPDFVQKIKNYRSMGTVAKINLALSSLPDFPALKDPNCTQGPHPDQSEIDYLERAFDESKYGNFSRQPRIWNQHFRFRRSVSGSSRRTCDVDLHAVRALQVEEQRLGTAEGRAGRSRRKDDCAIRSALGENILRHQIITPKDLEDTYGLTGGHIFHGELALDQFFTMRPLLDWARYKTRSKNCICAAMGRILARDYGRFRSQRRQEILLALKK